MTNLNKLSMDELKAKIIRQYHGNKKHIKHIEILEAEIASIMKVMDRKEAVILDYEEEVQSLKAKLEEANAIMKEVATDDNYGCPDNGNDEGMDKLKKYLDDSNVVWRSDFHQKEFVFKSKNK